MQLSSLVSRAVVIAAVAIVYAMAPGAQAQGDGGYQLVPNWPRLPAGMYFGLKEPPPPPAEREAQAAARRARGTPSGGGGQAGGQQTQPGISGLAIDRNDRIYAFNRGPKPVMVFDRDGNLVMSGADQEINGKAINPSWQHSGGVDDAVRVALDDVDIAVPVDRTGVLP